MPNWCINRVNIDHKDESKLKELENLINEWGKKDFMPNNFHGTWLGNIVGNSGIATKEELENFSICCRGTLEYAEVCGNTLLINTETANRPMIKMWKLIIDKYLPDATITYSSEEGQLEYLRNQRS